MKVRTETTITLLEEAARHRTLKAADLRQEATARKLRLPEMEQVIAVTREKLAELETELAAEVALLVEMDAAADLNEAEAADLRDRAAEDRRDSHLPAADTGEYPPPSPQDMNAMAAGLLGSLPPLGEPGQTVSVTRPEVPPFPASGVAAAGGGSGGGVGGPVGGVAAAPGPQTQDLIPEGDER